MQFLFPPQTQPKVKAAVDYQWNVDGLQRSEILRKECENVKTLDRYDFKYSSITVRKCHQTKCPIYVQEKPKMMFCNVVGAGEAILMNDLVEMVQERSSNKQFTPLMMDYSLKVSPLYYNEEKQNHFFKYFFVRHPFTRIATYYLGNKGGLARMFRFAGIASDNITFKDFVDYVLEREVSVFEAGFIPYSFMCQPCIIRYDFVGRMESLDEDRQQLYAKLNHSLAADSVYQKKFSEDLSKALKLFSEISRTDVKGLYEKYYYDFKLFDYSADVFASFAH